MSNGASSQGGGFSRGQRYAQASETIGEWLEQNRLPGYPLYYTETTQLSLNGAPSGLRGALGRLTITLSNYPHAVFGVMVDTFYDIPDAFIEAQPDYYVRQEQGGINDAMSLRLQLTQQNITQQPAPVISFNGGPGGVWRPFPTIYWFRAANQIVAELRRLQSYPRIVTEDEQEFRPVPEVMLTMVTVQLNSDYFPGSMPGSTGRP